jgi:branched-chain amino acid transport system substrate-binding protein
MRDLSLHFNRLWICLAAALVSTAVDQAWAQAPMRIVVAGPAAGRHAETLPAMEAGARRAAAGGDLVIESVDDGCDAARAEGAARDIAASKPVLVIGHPCPAAAIAAARIYAGAGVVFIALGVRHPGLTDQRAGPTIYRLAGRDDRQGAEAAADLMTLAAGGAIAIVQDRTAYARGLTAAVTGAIAAAKGLPPIVVPIVAGRRDYDAELAKLAGQPPAAIFFAGYPPEAAVVLRSLAKARIKAGLIASDANATDEFAQAAAGSQRPVKVMVRGVGSGGLDPSELGYAAGRAVSLWRAARAAGDPAAVLGHESGVGAGAFDAKGDARIASFVAVPLVAGRWSRSANASE